MREYIKDRAGRPLGSYERNDNARRIYLRDPSGRVLGYYDMNLNETRDAGGRMIARGNLLASLIESQF